MAAEIKPRTGRHVGAGVRRGRPSLNSATIAAGRRAGAF